MKITLIVPNLSNNCVARAHLLAEVLSKRYDVEITGILKEGHVWGPIQKDSSIKYGYLNGSIKNIFKDLKKINGDVIYIIKPVLPSMGYALIKSAVGKRNLIQDIDDWQTGLSLDAPTSKIIKNFLAFWDPYSLTYTTILEKIATHFNNITVSSHFLQKKFGGTIIPHARDVKQFNPKKYNPSKLKRKFGLENKKIVMFLGTIRKHKGIDDLINAIKLLDSKNVKLVLVGANFKDRYVQQLMKLSNNEITFIGEQPFDKIPEYLAVADLIAIHQKKSYSAMGQVPAKVFDAMAMAKPIISTNISDLPIILKDCGIIVEPGDINGLAEKIKFILDNPKIAKEMGKRAREKCVKEYSFEAIAPKLLKIFEKYEKVIAENQAKFKS